MEEQREQFYKVEELVELLNVHTKTVREMVKKGRLRGYMVGRALRFHPSDVEEFLARVETGEPSASSLPEGEGAV